MRIPSSLASLADQGIIEEVLRPLMSGKEAEVYLVRSGGEERVAKVYKHAQDRTFKHRAEYTEGRKVRNSRDQRAMNKRTSHGRAQDEAAWRSTEVDMIWRLRAAGVRVPTPHHFIDGVLIMELVTDADGYPAPRLGDLRLHRDEALALFPRLLAEVVRMLCAGVVHGDLSEFNVLMGADGPVVIDFPQSVDASKNQNARTLLVRDVGNLDRFVSRWAREWRPLPYAHEMWELYKRNELTPESRLGGRYRPSEKRADTAEVLALIGDADRDEQRRREALGLGTRGMSRPPRRVEVVIERRRAPPAPPREPARAVPTVARPPGSGRRRSKRRKSTGPDAPGQRAPAPAGTSGGSAAGPPARAAAPPGEGAPTRPRRRRRRRRGGPPKSSTG